MITNQVFELRTKIEVTQDGLAESLSVSRQTIAIEKGNYSPSDILAIKIGLFFKTPVEKIFKISYGKQ